VGLDPNKCEINACLEILGIDTKPVPFTAAHKLFVEQPTFYAIQMAVPVRWTLVDYFTGCLQTERKALKKFTSLPKPCKL